MEGLHPSDLGLTDPGKWGDLVESVPGLAIKDTAHTPSYHPAIKPRCVWIGFLVPASVGV